LRRTTSPGRGHHLLKLNIHRLPRRWLTRLWQSPFSHQHLPQLRVFALSVRGLHGAWIRNRRAAFSAKCRSLAMNETSGVASWAKCASYRASGGARTAAFSSITICQLYEPSVVSSKCYQRTIHLHGADPNASRICIHSLNSSANQPTSQASVLLIDRHFNLFLHFCIFSRNPWGNCLVFTGIHSGDISCFALLNNSCRPTKGSPSRSKGTAPVPFGRQPRCTSTCQFCRARYL
jgi:hypothetical protein